MYLGEAEDEQTKADLAIIIEETLIQRMQGVKNEKGVWITPAFPKIIYVLEEDNIYENSKYYYLTELAARCTAKRMVPDYISEKKMKEHKEGNCFPVMGCVDKDEVVTYKYKEEMYVESISRMWNRVLHEFGAMQQHEGEPHMYMDTAGTGLRIYDESGEFVEVRRMVKNWSDNWLKITFSNGRALTCTTDHPLPIRGRGRIPAENVRIGDEAYSVNDQYDTNSVKMSIDDAWELGYQIYWDRPSICEYDIPKEARHIPVDIFNATEEARLAFVGGLIFANRSFRQKPTDITQDKIKLHALNKEMALQIMQLILSLNASAFYYELEATDEWDEYDPRYLVEFVADEYTDILLMYARGIEAVKDADRARPPYCLADKYFKRYTEVIKIEHLNTTMWSYDVTTASDTFAVSGIHSHNCRSALSPWKDINGKYKFYGRFNQGVVTLNLPDVALSSGGDFEKFWKIFDERLDLCYKALMCRHKRLLGTSADVAPILWRHGAIARLEKGEKIDKLLYGGYSTISLGYAGLYECVKYMTGKSHTDKDATPFALEVMKYMNKKCDEWKEKTNIGFSIYGTPIESTTYKFAKCLQKRFGIIPGITDKNYITNSYHVVVTEDINAFDKLKFESQFQHLSIGGAISYVEVPNMQNNIPAVLTVMRYIYDNIIYAELNTKSDYCQECGYDGEIQIIEDEDGKLIWECPNCHNRDQNKMNVTRRTCGLT